MVGDKSSSSLKSSAAIPRPSNTSSSSSTSASSWRVCRVDSFDSQPFPTTFSAEAPAASTHVDLFTDLDPLGSGRNKPYVDKKDFFQDLKKPAPKRLLKQLTTSHVEGSLDRPTEKWGHGNNIEDPFGSLHFVPAAPVAEIDPFDSQFSSHMTSSPMFSSSFASAQPPVSLSSSSYSKISKPISAVPPPPASSASPRHRWRSLSSTTPAANSTIELQGSASFIYHVK